MAGLDYDVVVIGSGFGGSVAALRLTEKGYRVAVLEAGQRFDDPSRDAPADRHRALPRNSWHTRRYLWAPALRAFGIQRIHLLRGEKGARVLVLAGAGVGGGSLVYANTLYEPPPPFYADPQWGHITDWRDELAPHYDQAKRMLGVTVNPTMTPADKAVRNVAVRMGRAETFRLTPVGVYFGERPGEQAADPYFGGAGPRRAACTECGSCMTGCRSGAKNMLTENYLYLAERAGARVIPMTTVTAVRPQAAGGYQVDVVTTGRVPRRPRTLTAGQVVVAAGTYGTQKLLHRMKATGTLPHLSGRLGALTRTNSEAILGAERFRSRGPDHSRGVAITSSFHPDDDTHVEPTRDGPGSNAMGTLRTLLVDGGGRAPRWLTFLGLVARRPWDVVRLPNLRNWSRRTVIALVMQTRDNSVTVRAHRGPFGWTMRSAARPRRTKPDLDPGGPPGRPAARRGAGRDRGRNVAGPVQHPDHGAFPRRLRDRRLPRLRGHRPVPPRVRAPGAAHRGRLGGIGQPGREPVADDHRPGRAGHGGLAEPRRAGPAPAARGALPAGRGRSPGAPGRAGAPAALRVPRSRPAAAAVCAAGALDGRPVRRWCHHDTRAG